MGQIIEFIMSNLFMIIIIISAILGFFNNQNKENDKKQHEQPKRKPVKPSSPPKREAKQEPIGKNVRPEPVSIETVEEQQQKQMEKLAKALNTSTKQAIDEVSELPGDLTMMMLNEKKGKSLVKERSELKNRVQKDLKGKQLMNGIIMAEVLGPPRAIKPYRSVVEERRRR